MYALVEIGSKQYRVEKDCTLNVDKIRGHKDDSFTIDKVLMFVDGDKVMLGDPYLDNVEVTADVLGTIKGKKVRGIKFKKRKNYTRTLGYRPLFLQLRINSISLK